MNPYTLQLVDGPAIEPVTVDDCKAHLQLLGGVASDQEDYITKFLIPAARRGIELECNRLLGEQTWELGLPNWWGIANDYGYGALLSAWPAALQAAPGYGRAPADYFGPSHILFPRPPLIDVRRVRYTRSDMSVITLEDLDGSPPVTSDLFFVETGSEPGFLMLKPGKTWPSDTLAPGYPIKIRFRAGLAVVPQNLQLAVLLSVAHYFSNRESVVVSDSRVQALEVPQALSWLCDPSRFWEYQ